MIDKGIIAAIAAYDKRVYREEAASRINIIRHRKFDDETQVLMFEYICDFDPELSGRSSAIIVDNKVYVTENWDECPFTDEEVKKNTWIEAIAGNEIIILGDHTPDNQKPVSPDLTEEELLTLWKSGKLWIML